MIIQTSKEKLRWISKLDKIIVTDNKVIKVDGGNVMHGMKSMILFKGFGELYFSWVQNYIKAWKHKLMTLNLVVPFKKLNFYFTMKVLLILKL